MTPQSVRFDESEEEDVSPIIGTIRRVKYPSSAPVEHDKIAFASFASLSMPGQSVTPRRLLFIGYENGLQIWDATHLGEVQEILNRKIAGAVVACHVLPSPQISPKGEQDQFADQRPLIGIAYVLC